MTAEITFWDNIAERYAARPVQNMDAYEKTLERVRSYIGPEHAVLEVGCGTGTTALKLAPHTGHTTATDFSPAMVAIGEAKARDAGVTNVRFKALDAASPEFGKDGYDVVMGFNLLHLVKDVDGTLATLQRTLVKGGTLITKTPCLEGWPFGLLRVALPVMRLFGKAPKGKLNFFRIADLEARIERAGFRIIETGNYPASPPNRFVVATKL
ncbi:class I SAM-dependent methyltransferase [Ovoidimarina sediminis]|uniref:class I SAM-dependent methyltransferase n=1 Tax=Ovoidimarina sediminis TaxID=3079856 RepID=UPI00290F3C82|nr:class I SAM-dependent methyltransferase [Rhodophyticola sp. MJ-SS7]MDU8943970.1 class I SAM-dependent methyltransferase [Rhodophyticola sp. MJ-SS7]